MSARIWRERRAMRRFSARHRKAAGRNHVRLLAMHYGYATHAEASAAQRDVDALVHGESFVVTMWGE